MRKSGWHTRRKGTRNSSIGLLPRVRRWLLGALALLWVAAVIASHIPEEHLPELPMNGKIFHVLGFFGLTSLFVLLLTAHDRRGLRRDLIVLLVMCAYAAFDEGTQPYFHRNGCVSDWLLDTGSTVLALVACRVVALCLRPLICQAEKAQEMQRKIERYLEP